MPSLWFDWGFYVVLAIVGLTDAYLVSSALPVFVSTIVHTAVIALSCGKIHELRRVLYEKDAHDKVERMQCELITNLTLYNSKLLMENKIMAYKLDRAVGIKSRSRSCGNMNTL